jgi:hypothetical protein
VRPGPLLGPEGNVYGWDIFSAGRVRHRYRSIVVEKVGLFFYLLTVAEGVDGKELENSIFSKHQRFPVYG